MLEFGFKFHKSLFLMVQIGPFPTAMVIEPSSLTHICITRFQWVNQNQNSSSKWVTDILWYPVQPGSVRSFVIFWSLSLQCMSKNPNQWKFCLHPFARAPPATLSYNVSSLVSRDVKLPWIFLGVPLTFNGAPAGNIQGNLTALGIADFDLEWQIVITWLGIFGEKWHQFFHSSWLN